MKPGWKRKAQRQSTRSGAASALRSRRLGELGNEHLRRAVTRAGEGTVAPSAGLYQLYRAKELLAAQPRAGYASPPVETPGSRDQDDAAREQRRQVLRRVRGMWKERVDAPRDGLQYQLESRAEWDR